MFSLAASGGGSSHPTSSASDRFFGHESIAELYRSTLAFLETVDSADRKDLQARLKSLVHIDGPLDPMIVGVFFQVVCQESVRNQSYEDYDHLREQLEKLFGFLPEVKSSFGSHNDGSTMTVHVTDIKGESKTLHFPTRMVINSAVMRDFMEKRAAVGAGDTEPAWTFQLPPFCTFESFHDYLSFYQTETLDESSLEKSCQLLKLADYFMDDKMCVSIVEQLEPCIREFASLDVLKMMINTLGACIPGRKLIDLCLRRLINYAVHKKQSDRFFAELAGSELKEVLAGLDISLSLEGSNITDELVKQLTIAFPAMKGLSIEGGNITHAGLDHLRGLTSLEILDLSGCSKITWLTTLPSLTSLNLSDCCNMRNAGLACLADLPSLEILGLSGCSKITHEGLAGLEALTSLKILDLSGCFITDAGLARLTSLRSLTSLNLSDCHITDAGLDRLRALTSLRFLNLSGCYITDAGLALLETLPCLRYLYLSSGTRSSAEGRARLAEKEVQIIWVKDC